MMTTECARKSLPLWLMCRDQHMGGFFASHLGMQWQDYLDSFYVWPPAGGFWAHICTTCSTPKAPSVSQNHFGHTWSQEGTRKLNDFQNHRWIAKFTAKGKADFHGAPVELPDLAAAPRLAHAAATWNPRRHVRLARLPHGHPGGRETRDVGMSFDMPICPVSGLSASPP